jgi:hypothetical protein
MLVWHTRRGEVFIETVYLMAICDIIWPLLLVCHRMLVRAPHFFVEMPESLGTTVLERRVGAIRLPVCALPRFCHFVWTFLELRTLLKGGFSCFYVDL